MLIDTSRVQRLAIYFFYDKDGVADDYNFYMLDDIMKNVSELIVVVNGLITEKSIEKFQKYTKQILVRDNVGFDVWAYKTAIDYLGWQKISQYDEIILMNFTLMGPLYPLKEVFDEMAHRDIDFWGLTINHGASFAPYKKCKYGYLPTYLPTNFLVIRKSLAQSEELHKYWAKMPMIRSVDDSIALHESVFTKYFHDLGYEWSVYCDTRDILDHSNYPMIREPLLLLTKYRCPVVKRKSFFYEYENLLSNSNGNQAARIMAYLRACTDYDTGLIWQNILRTQNLADVKRCLQLNYVLPSALEMVPLKRRISVALISHQYYEDLFESGYEYAASMPKWCDVYITTDTQEKKEKLEQIYGQRGWHKLSVHVVKNRGRNMGALLLNFQNIVPQYEYVCVVHGLKASRYKRTIKGRTLAYECMENLLSTETYVSNVLSTFENEPNLGMLIPPPPVFGDYYKNLGQEWGNLFPIVQNLADRFSLHVETASNKEPIAPVAGMFWIRGEILAAMYSVQWDASDFTAERFMRQGGSLQEAVSYFLPFLAQNKNYYTGWVMSDAFSAVEITNLHHMLRELTQVCFKKFTPCIHRELLSRVSASDESDVRAFGKRLKRHLPLPLYERLKRCYFWIQKVFAGRKGNK